MPRLIIMIITVFNFFIYSQNNDLMDTSNRIREYISLTTMKIEKNSPIIKIDKIEGEDIIIVKGNIYNTNIDNSTGKVIDDIRGKVILFGDVINNYNMNVQMKFLGANIDLEGAGWFGFVIRAQDCDNYGVVWFMPGGAEGNNNIAYIPVAHGVIPWWTESYLKQEKGSFPLPKNDWFEAEIIVNKDEFSVFVNGTFIFKKKLTYYLLSGRPGLFIGTATDVMFRKIQIKDLDN
ncbi:MAG: hypothetical protein V3S42_00830 [Candidatus Neomarinimicrobiota bacterium]